MWAYRMVIWIERWPRIACRAGMSPVACRNRLAKAQVVAPEWHSGSAGDQGEPVGEARVTDAITVPEHIGCGGVPTNVPTAASLSGTTPGLEVFVLVNLTSRRWVDTCDHSSPQTSS
jgi:hypothetical protein